VSDVLGWWFAKRDEDGEVRLPHGDGRIVRVGETLTVPGPVVLCERGLHAGVQAHDALQYAPGGMLCRVRLSGQIVHGNYKVVATERTTLAMVDATRTLRVFACCVARGALEAERLLGREPDPRSWAAVEVAARYLDGNATDAELAAARAAARAAAWVAARAAAWDAAWDATWYAAGAAARAAARAAAWVAAWDATWDAARAAARAAARDAARAIHADVLERMCLKAVGEETGEGKRRASPPAPRTPTDPEPGR
jgi:hypothetical protein